MGIGVTYRSTDGSVVVQVDEFRKSPQPGVDQVRTMYKDFGNSAKAQDDALIFVHSLNHGEIKLDDILPPWTD